MQTEKLIETSQDVSPVEDRRYHRTHARATEDEHRFGLLEWFVDERLHGRLVNVDGKLPFKVLDGVGPPVDTRNAIVEPIGTRFDELLSVPILGGLCCEIVDCDRSAQNALSSSVFPTRRHP